MRKKTNKTSVTLLFFIVLGCAFYVMWNNKLTPDLWKNDIINQDASQSVGSIFTLEPLVIELSGRYLDVIHEEGEKSPKLSTRKKLLDIIIDLELRDKKDISSVQKQIGQIKTVVIETVSSKKVKDIETVEGKAALIDEMIENLNRILPDNTVSKIHYKKFIIR